MHPLHWLLILASPAVVYCLWTGNRSRADDIRERERREVAWRKREDARLGRAALREMDRWRLW